VVHAGQDHRHATEYILFGGKKWRFGSKNILRIMSLLYRLLHSTLWFSLWKREYIDHGNWHSTAEAGANQCKNGRSM
jgi:hypothetical protein